MRPDDRNGSGGTLSGNKKSVYILLKILKLLRNGSITSFTLKYATDRGLEEVVYETAALGPSLQRVLRLDVNWNDGSSEPTHNLFCLKAIELGGDINENG